MKTPKPPSYASTLCVTVIIIVGFSRVSGNSCPSGENPDNITWCKTGEDTFKTKLDGKFDAKGLQPWFDLSVSFVNTVLNKEPYDIVLKVAKGGDIDYQKDVAFGYALGMVICCGFGILFCLLMPIVGFCFCCCRICGKCGGEMVQKENPRDACKRAVFGILLLIITLLMLCGVLLTFVCNDRMSNSIDASKTTGINVADEAKEFMNQTLKDVDKVIAEFNYTVNNINEDISDSSVKTLIGDPAFNRINPHVKDPINQVKDLSKDAAKMSNQLSTINNNTEALQNQGNDLQHNLTIIKKNLTEITAACKSAPTCEAPDLDGLALDANFTNVPDISAQLSNIQDVVNSDFDEAAKEGYRTFTEIPDTLINKTRDSRQKIGKLVGDARGKVDELTSNLSSTVNEKVFDQLDEAKSKINEYADIAKQYDHYRWLAGVGLTCILLLIVVLLGLGLMCGICGHDKDAVPTTRGTVSNMGGLSLMAAVGFCFIFASFLMLLTTICFIIGAPFQKVCGSIENDGFYKLVLDKKDFMGAGKGYLLGDVLYGNGSIELTIHGLLADCRKNKPIYDAAKINNSVDVDKMFNIKELLGDTVDKTLEQLNTNLTDQEVLTPEARRSLNNLSTSGVEEIDFDKFLNETRKEITKVNLTELAANVSRMAVIFRTAGNYTLGNRSEAIAEELRDLDRISVAAMKAKADELEMNVNELKQIGGDLKNKSTKVLHAAEEAERYIKVAAGEDIKADVKDYIDRVLGWGYKFTEHLLDVLKNDLAKCKPVSSIHDAIVSAVCKEFVYSFNGFWLAIGFCLFFFIPAIIFGVKLAKRYRRMNYEPDFDQAYNQNEMYEMGPGQPILPSYAQGQSVGVEKKLWAQPQNNPAVQNRM